MLSICDNFIINNELTEIFKATIFLYLYIHEYQPILNYEIEIEAASYFQRRLPVFNNGAKFHMKINLVHLGFITVIFASSPTTSKASWNFGQGDFKDFVLNCVDSIGEWGEDFFCIGFACRDSDLNLVHISSSGDFSRNIIISIENPQISHNTQQNFNLYPDIPLSEISGTIVEYSRIGSDFWQEILNSYRISVGPGNWIEYSTVGLDLYTDSLTSQCQPY